MRNRLFISGTSHAGKSTLARRIGQTLNWPVFSTDRMGRHPGRPWEKAPPHVLEFYERMSAEAIHTFLQHHHLNMWPGIMRLIDDHQHRAAPFVLEGAALRPKYLTDVAADAVCLTATDNFLRQRIYDASSYITQTTQQQAITDAFVDRSLRENELLQKEAIATQVTCLNVSDQDEVDRFFDAFIANATPKET